MKVSFPDLKDELFVNLIGYKVDMMYWKYLVKYLYWLESFRNQTWFIYTDVEVNVEKEKVKEDALQLVSSRKVSKCFLGTICCEEKLFYFNYSKIIFQLFGYSWAFPRVRAALLKIKSTTYKLFFAIFLTTVLL